MNIHFPTVPTAIVMQPWGNVNFRMYPAPTGRHMGLDIGGVPVGTSVFAAADGFVETASEANAHGYGRHIILQHSGFRTLYAHLHRLYVREGQAVQAGDEIGQMGGDPKDSDPIDGASTGTHLHFEVILRSQPEGDSIGTWAGYTVDPIPFLQQRFAPPPLYKAKVLVNDGVRIRALPNADKSTRILGALLFNQEYDIAEKQVVGTDTWARLWTLRPEWAAVEYAGKEYLRLSDVKPAPMKPVADAPAIDEKAIRREVLDHLITLLEAERAAL